MNRKQLSLLFALLIVLGGLGLLMQRNHNSTPEAAGGGAEQKLLGKDFPWRRGSHHNSTRLGTR